MRPDNPAAKPCENIEKGPEHVWIRRADGTAYCANCAASLDPSQASEAFPLPEVSSVSKKAGGGAAKA